MADRLRPRHFAAIARGHPVSARSVHNRAARATDNRDLRGLARGILGSVPPFSPPSEGVCISGAMVLNNVRAFAEIVGQPTVDAALAGLPGELVNEFRAVVPAAWVPMRVVDEIFAAIALASGRDLEELFPLAVERGVEQTLTSVWRVLMRFTTDAMLISAAPRIFRKTYDRGRLSATFPAPRCAEVVLNEWPNPPKYRLLAIAAGIRTVLRLAGRVDPRTRISRTDDGARFEVRWSR